VFFFEDESTARLSSAARELFLRAIAYAKRNRTNGRVPKDIMHTLYSPIRHEAGEIELRLNTKWITGWSPDGHPVVTRAAIKNAAMVSVRDTVSELIDEQLVTVLDDGSYHIVSYLKWQEDDEVIENKKKKAASKKRKQRARAKNVSDMSPGDKSNVPGGHAGDNGGDKQGDKSNVPGGQTPPDSDSDLDLSTTTEIHTRGPEPDRLSASGVVVDKSNKGESKTFEELMKRYPTQFGQIYGEPVDAIKALLPIKDDELETLRVRGTRHWGGVRRLLPLLRADPDAFMKATRNGNGNGTGAGKGNGSFVNGPTARDKKNHEVNERLRREADPEQGLTHLSDIRKRMLNP